ncbi:helix-turn-helix domain-containing protein [Umezawaea endophytica]|uniref:Helix-turn-helix domain-containing protein n=1 Tax=Umezawaea endophytica TaxID=1654476 RepID=A0A9X2VHE5_9PSEU|nr:helix-turn-helix domain-containing protein [Umezawaea endophytica]MCS7476137.1 helix-turn-helix domain-containing protein [Umezawaea endophytica]
MSYEERPALGGLGLAWTKTSSGAGPSRVVPDGCTDIIWSRDANELFVAGPDTCAKVGAGSSSTLFAVRFKPGVGPAAFGVPAHVLRDLRVPLADLWPSADRLVDELNAATDPCAVLVDAAGRRLRETPPDPALGAVVAAVRDHRVPEVADRLGIGARQLHRRSLAAFGYGPKVLARVLRFDRAMGLAWAGVPFAEIAHRAGYADQAHLSREVKDLAGVPLGVLLGR